MLHNMPGRGPKAACVTWWKEEHPGSCRLKACASWPPTTRVRSLRSPMSAATPTQYIGRFQYTGQAWLEDLGVYHYKARIYSPTLGRFLQTDPIGYDD